MLALPIVIAALVLVGYWFTRQWLLPLDRMAAEAKQITVDDLGRRLPVVNRDKRLVGVVSLGDLSLTGKNKAAGEALLEISQPGH